MLTLAVEETSGIFLGTFLKSKQQWQALSVGPQPAFHVVYLSESHSIVKYSA